MPNFVLGAQDCQSTQQETTRSIFVVDQIRFNIQCRKNTDQRNYRASWEEGVRNGLLYDSTLWNINKNKKKTVTQAGYYLYLVSLRTDLVFAEIATENLYF